jgi:hypothetical protein
MRLFRTLALLGIGWIIRKLLDRELSRLLKPPLLQVGGSHPDARRAVGQRPEHTAGLH